MLQSRNLETTAIEGMVRSRRVLSEQLTFVYTKKGCPLPYLIDYWTVPLEDF
jgi:hypothetical protein